MKCTSCVDNSYGASRCFLNLIIIALKKESHTILEEQANADNSAELILHQNMVCTCARRLTQTSDFALETNTKRHIVSRKQSKQSAVMQHEKYKTLHDRPSQSHLRKDRVESRVRVAHRSQYDLPGR